MKRYKLELTKYDRQLLDDPNGEWVRFEEAEAWRKRALAAEALSEARAARNDATYERAWHNTNVNDKFNAWLVARDECERLEK